jgi:hypothetical protein
MPAPFGGDAFGGKVEYNFFILVSVPPTRIQQKKRFQARDRKALVLRRRIRT